MKWTTAHAKTILSRKRNRYLLAGGLLLATAAPGFALFGLGDIVFDPTSYASLASQLTTLTMQFNMLKANFTNFSVKTMWRTDLQQLKTVNVSNSFGETNGFSTALNNNSTTAATTAWTSSSVALSPDAKTKLATEPVGNSAQLSQLALVEASDTASPDCINAVGSYRQARTTAAAAQQNLENEQLDGTTATNSEVQQLNLLNAASAQALNEQQAQGALHTCLAEQIAIQNMQQRNAAAEDLNLWGFVSNQQATTANYNVASSNAWTTYIP